MTVDIDEKIPSLLKEGDKLWVTAVNPHYPFLGFRYGPMRAQDAGDVMRKCLKMNIKPMFTFECGPEIDWDVLKDMCGTLPVDGGPVE